MYSYQKRYTGTYILLSLIGLAFLGSISFFFTYLSNSSIGADGTVRCNNEVMQPGDECVHEVSYNGHYSSTTLTYDQQAQQQADERAAAPNMLTLSLVCAAIGIALIVVPIMMAKSAAKAAPYRPAASVPTSRPASPAPPTGLTPYRPLNAPVQGVSMASSSSDAAAYEKRFLASIEKYTRANPQRYLLRPGDDAPLDNALGLTKRQQGREAAIALLDRVIAVAPDRAVDIYTRKADLLYELQRHEESIKALDPALALWPEYIAAYFMKLRALLALKRYDEVLAVSEQVLRFKGEWNYGYHAKGKALLGLKRYDEALQMLDRAMVGRWAPDDPEFFLDKGLVLLALGRREEARTVLGQAIFAQPKVKRPTDLPSVIEALYRRALLSMNDGNAKAAQTDLNEALRLDPNHSGAKSMLPHVLEQIEKPV